jgi:photosystem II stability/assembly factor-like uncharacterized protein
LFFINDNTGFIGRYKTFDGGNTWIDVFNDLLEEYESIDGLAFVDSVKGWAICSGRIFKTVNGGDSWEIVDQYSTHALYDICFSGGGMGWIAGMGSNIFKKSEDSNDWIKVTEGTTNNLKDIYFINNNVGWCVGHVGTILHTIDGGISWIKQDCPVDSLLLSVKFLSDQIGWAVGYNIALYTEDGGDTWEVKDDLYGYFVDVDFFDEQVGLIIDYYGKVYKTENSGASWQSTIVPHTLTCLEIIDSEKACIGGVSGLMFTTDKGSSIQWYDLAAISKIRELQFVNEDVGYIRNDRSEIFCTTNGGQSWTILDNSSTRIDAIYMLSSNVGWFFSGRNLGYLERIEINNYNIEVDDSEIYKVAFIEKMYFKNDSCGWGIGPGGTILKYGNSNDSISGADSSRVLIYPNPCTLGNFINIEFDLNSFQNIQIDLFNVNGKFIRNIVNYTLPEGNNNIVFNGSGLTSGIYLLSFRTDDHFECKKILLLK